MESIDVSSPTYAAASCAAARVELRGVLADGWKCFLNSQRIFDTLALEALRPRAFDIRLIMVDGHDLIIRCYTYVEYNMSSQERAHNFGNFVKQYFSINSIYNYI